MKTVRDALLRLKLCPDDYQLVLLDQDGNDYHLDEILVNPDPAAKQVWVSFLAPDLEEDDGEDWEGDTRAGDMCALPEVSGEPEKEKPDVCEVISRGKSKRA